MANVQLRVVKPGGKSSSPTGPCPGRTARQLDGLHGLDVVIAGPCWELAVARVESHNQVTGQRPGWCDAFPPQPSYAF